MRGVDFILIRVEEAVLLLSGGEDRVILSSSEEHGNYEDTGDHLERFLLTN